MPITAFTIPALADLIGDIDAEIKALDKRLKAAKAELGERDIERADGARYSVLKVEAMRWQLDLSAAKEELGDAWCIAHSKTSLVVSYRVAVQRSLAEIV